MSQDNEVCGGVAIAMIVEDQDYDFRGVFFRRRDPNSFVATANNQAVKLVSEMLERDHGRFALPEVVVQVSFRVDPSIFPHQLKADADRFESFVRQLLKSVKAWMTRLGVRDPGDEVPADRRFTVADDEGKGGTK